MVLMGSKLKTEKPDMPPAELRKTATHVITGKVLAISERNETADDWKYTRYVAEIQISTIEKGQSLKTGDLIYARYWRRIIIVFPRLLSVAQRDLAFVNYLF
jgi:hypothetical protein